ncbi:MAG: hypothetical protein ACF8MJ_03760 [Phycisphaerales bacterium JB050]
MRIAPLLPAAALALACGTAAFGEPVSVTFLVDSEVSVTTLEICESITGSCDSDTSPITGSVVLWLEPGQDPDQASIFDFHFALTETLNLSYNLGFGQTLTMTAEDLETDYALDGPTGPQPVGPNGELLFPAVPLVNSGTLSYNTSTILCAILQAQDIPCSAAIELGEVGVVEPPIEATLTRNGDFYILDLDISITFDSDDLPDSPPVSGTITTSIQAVAPVPAPECPADVNDSGSVDLADLNIVLANFGQATSEGDTNGDGNVDLADLNAVLAAFGQSCS